MEEKKVKDISHNPINYYDDDEIDLYELWLTLKKRWKVVAITTAIFVIIAMIYIFQAKPVYKSSFTIRLPDKGGKLIITSAEIKQIIENLNLLKKEKRYSEMSILIHIPEEKIKSISKISVEQVKTSNNLVKINIQSTDKYIFPELEKGLIDYISKNPYLKEKIEDEKEIIKFSLNQIKSKLTDLEKLKNDLIKKIKNGQIKEIGFNPLDLEGKIMYFKNQIKSMEIQLKHIRGIEISSNSIVPEKPFKPKKLLILAVSLISGIFLGIFLVFFVHWLSEAREKHRKEKS